MEIQIFFIHFSYIQMIAEFNSYMSNIDIDFFKELCSETWRVTTL